MRSEPFHSGGTAGKHAKLPVDSSNSPGCVFVPISDLFPLPYSPPELQGITAILQPQVLGEQVAALSPEPHALPGPVRSEITSSRI